VFVGVLVAVFVAVRDGVEEGVAVRVTKIVSVNVGVTLAVPVFVGVLVAVFVAVRDGVEEDVAVKVTKIVSVNVAVGVAGWAPAGVAASPATRSAATDRPMVFMCMCPPRSGSRRRTVKALLLSAAQRLVRAARPAAVARVSRTMKVSGRPGSSMDGYLPDQPSQARHRRRQSPAA